MSAIYAQLCEQNAELTRLRAAEIKLHTLLAQKVISRWISVFSVIFFAVGSGLISSSSYDAAPRRFGMGWAFVICAIALELIRCGLNI